MTQKYGFRWSQDILRVFLFISAGVGLVKLKWYFGFPLMFILFTLAHIIENIGVEIRQIKRRTKTMTNKLKIEIDKINNIIKNAKVKSKILHKNPNEDFIEFEGKKYDAILRNKLFDWFDIQQIVLYLEQAKLSQKQEDDERFEEFINENAVRTYSGTLPNGEKHRFGSFDLDELKSKLNGEK